MIRGHRSKNMDNLIKTFGVSFKAYPKITIQSRRLQQQQSRQRRQQGPQRVELSSLTMNIIQGSVECKFQLTNKDEDGHSNMSSIVGGNLTFRLICFFIISTGLDTNISCFQFLLSEVLHGSEEHHLGKGNQLAEDEPVVDHLGGRGGGQALHLADEDRCRHQHGGEVDAEGCLKEERLKEGGGKGDCSEKKGGEVGRHHLTEDLPLHRKNHGDSLFLIR